MTTPKHSGIELYSPEEVHALVRCASSAQDCVAFLTAALTGTPRADAAGQLSAAYTGPSRADAPEVSDSPPDNVPSD